MPKLRILVLGYIVRGPWGGMVWHHLQYLVGLARMGHDVYFLEDADDFPSCYTPFASEGSEDPNYGIEFLTSILAAYGLEQRWAYYDSHSSNWLGPLANNIHEIVRSADLLLNLSGVNPIRPWLETVPRRAFVDTDPVFIQVRHLTQDHAHHRAAQHNRFLSYGENFGQPGCTTPADGFPWKPTRQPVVLDLWNHSETPTRECFTTVMQWNSYPPLEFRGLRYGMKSDSMREFASLPAQSPVPLEMAAKGLGKEADWLRSLGWSVIDSNDITVKASDYQAYLRSSSGEFSVAKHGYVVSNSGWFSERTASYLALGRPAVVQETGFSQWLPTGLGLVPFTNRDEAVAGLTQVRDNWAHHAHAAREIAAEFFEAEKVLRRLIDDCA